LEITDQFCPRLIVVNGRVRLISKAAHFHSSGNRLWIPSTIKIIPSKWTCEEAHIQSLSFEIGSKLRKIGNESFSETGLQFLTVPFSIEVLSSQGFYKC
jgi:hypothetical protein